MAIVTIAPMTPEEFEKFRNLLYTHAGIALSSAKQPMLAGRLAKRLQFYRLPTYEQYYRLLGNEQFAGELEIFVNILTTNETYFFREPQHFIFLRDEILKFWRGAHFRAWSAACSSGEEAYSLAMVLAESLGLRHWDVLGTDVNTQKLDVAGKALYPLARLEQMDQALLTKYCLKGVRSQQGYFRVDAKIRNRIKFAQVNLKKPLSADLGLFNVIFLRNVLIYFDRDTRQEVVARLLQHLQPQGYFIIGHAESLHQVTDRLEMLQPSIFRKSC